MARQFKDPILVLLIINFEPENVIEFLTLSYPSFTKCEAFRKNCHLARIVSLGPTIGTWTFSFPSAPKARRWIEYATTMNMKALKVGEAVKKSGTNSCALGVAVVKFSILTPNIRLFTNNCESLAARCQNPLLITFRIDISPRGASRISGACDKSRE